MNKKQMLQALKAYERAENYRQKAENKVDYWWEKRTAAYDKMSASLNLQRGQSIMIGDYLFYRADSYDSSLKITKIQKL